MWCWEWVQSRVLTRHYNFECEMALTGSFLYLNTWSWIGDTIYERGSFRTILVIFLFPWQNAMTKATYREKKCLMGACSFRGLIHDCPCRDKGDKKANMGLEQQLRAFVWPAAMRQRRTINWEWCGFLESQSPITVTHIIQQDQTPNPSHQSPPTGKQAFKYMCLWGYSHSNHQARTFKR